MKKSLGIFVWALLITAVQVQASQKIVSFEAAYRGGAIVKNIESIGGRVTKQFEIIDALVAVFPDNIKTDAIHALAGVTNVEEDSYIKWIEESSVNTTPFPSLEEALSAIVADPESKVDDAVKVSLGKAFERVAPKKAAPVNPSNPVRGWDETTGTYRSSSAGPASFEELQKLGASAVESFASKSPEAFAKLRDDWQRRLANPGARR